jgi:hypothetical protein
MSENDPTYSKLPTIAEIEKGDLAIPGKLNALNVLLNQEPPNSWIKKQDGISHLPIDKVKYLLTKIFIEWYTEIKSVIIIANSVTVILTLHFKNPITREWQKTDGIGAAPINTKKGSAAMDWNEIIHDSVHKCGGAAKAFALKNAAKDIGKIFGAGLNIDDVIDYSSLINPERFENATLTEK